MTSLVFWPFLTYLPTYLVLLYNVPFLELSWTPLPTLILDVNNERSLWDHPLKTSAICRGERVKNWSNLSMDSPKGNFH